MDSGTQMHFLESAGGSTPGRPVEGNEAQTTRTLGTLDGVEPGRESRDRRELETPLRDPELLANERLYAEMLGRLAPATESRVVNPGRKRRGRLVFGDDTGQPR